MGDVFVGIFAVVILVAWAGGLLYVADHVIALVKRIAGKRRGVNTSAAADHPSRRGRRSLDTDADADRLPDPVA